MTLTPVTASEPCTVSVTDTSTASDGPALLTSMVKLCVRALRYGCRVEGLDDRQVDVDQDVDGVAVVVSDVIARVARITLRCFGSDRRDVRTFDVVQPTAPSASSTDEATVKSTVIVAD